MQRARRGALWTGGSAILLRFSNVLVMVIVARIITPAELGVYALAIAVHGFVVCVAAWGVGAAIGRSDLDVDKLGPTVVTFTVCSSLVTAGALVALAGPIASGLGTPEAATAIRILAICVVFTGLFAVPMGQNQRAFRQDVVFRGNVLAFFVSSAGLLLLVQFIPGAEAFAWSRVVGHLIVGLTVVLSLDKRFWPGWHSGYLVPLLRFGVPAALGGVLSEVVLNIDYVIIGREMSTAHLGQYMLAFNIAAWPTAVLGAVLASIVLPAFSAVRRDGGDLRLTVARAVRTIAYVACPIAAFTCAFSHSLIETVYGSKWLAAAPVLSVLAVFGVVYVLGLLFDNILIASGHTVAMFGIQSAALVVLVPALIAGVHIGGLVGVGVAHTVVIVIVTMPVYIWTVFRITGAGFAVVLRSLARPLLAAVTASGIALVATGSVAIPALELAAALLIGSIVYLAVVGPAILPLAPPRIAHLRVLVLATTWPALLTTAARGRGPHHTRR